MYLLVALTAVCVQHLQLCTAFLPHSSVNRISVRTETCGVTQSLKNSDKNSVSDEVLNSLTTKLDRSNSEAAADAALAPPEPSKKKDNNAMAFLRKVGRVGGAANKNFVNAVGSDEGSTGRQPPASRNVASGLKKAKQAYTECTQSGTIDDMTDPFPLTSSGTEWRGVSDRVMGGLSQGFIKRETDLDGRVANLLTGHVSLANNGGFIQMVTDLAIDPGSINAVDASEYDGIELDVFCRHESRRFNVHLRTPGTLQQVSYRYTHTLEIEGKWELIRIPFSSFEGYGMQDMESLDTSELRRIGIVAIGEEMDVFLAVAGVRFYSVF